MNNGKDFEWNESTLHEIAKSIDNGRVKDHEVIKVKDINFVTRFKTLNPSAPYSTLNDSICRLLNKPYDLSMNITVPEQNKKQSFDYLVSNWCKSWEHIAEKFSISYIDTRKNVLNFRKVCIIPNLIPILAIGHTKENNIFIIYGKNDESRRDVPLRTLLRYSYSNIPAGDIQTINFLTKSLLEIFSQLYMRGVSPIFKTKYFKCSPCYWLEFDYLGEILDSMETETKKILTLEEVTWKWVHREIDNYEYLSYLNETAGRIRGEVHNHPIFPWVCDFSSKNGGFRPLNRTKYRLNKGDDQLREMYSREPSHHVPELLSDIGYMSYRSRVESKENLCKHVRRKWVPEEYPSNLRRIYEWTPDECIPEFYDDPSIFASRHPDMQDLQYPDFVSSAEEFIKWHREMLEREEVSDGLHRWIDLVFGYQLSPEESKHSLNLHLCFVEKHKRGIRTNGMVQLFSRPHPKRIHPGYNPKEDNYRLKMESCWLNSSKENMPSRKEGVKEDNSSIFNIYQKIKEKRRIRETSYFESMVSLIELIAQITVSPHLRELFDDSDHIVHCIQQNGFLIPQGYRDLFSFLLNKEQQFPNPDEFSFFLTTVLNIPPSITDFYEEFSKCMGYHTLRSLPVVKLFSKRSQFVLLKEVQSLKESIKRCGHMEICVTATFQNLLEDEEASIQAVHKLMPVIARCLSQSALEEMIPPMVELIQCETSVKLLDRRFLLYVSICYGTHKFLDIFLPPIIEACSSKNFDRSIVARESIAWLSKRYGPVICAKFVSSSLLRVMASCYEGFEVSGDCQEPKNVFDLVLIGDENCSRIESLLTEIVITYSATFITIQFLPFCVDLIDQYFKRSSSSLESGLVSVFRIVDLSIRSMSDHQLMNYLEEYIIQKIIYRIFTILLDTNFQISTDRIRNIILCKANQLLLYTAQKIGVENTRIYADRPFKLLFSTFLKIYSIDTNLEIVEKRRSEGDENIYQLPLWFVEDVIDRFAKEWGVPFLSSFCMDPSFLIPFVSNLASATTSVNIPQSTPPVFTAYTLNSMQPGNRLFSLSSPSQSSSVGSLGGLSLCEAGTLSDVWCARVSAAVCGSKTLRFDHLTLCSFNGHAEKIRKFASISNENSFVSASTDKTVKLWSIKPEQDEIGCQWTYKYHTRSINDITILADNAIASTDGCLHVWDPFRSSILSQLDWNADGIGGNIIAIQNVDRHTLAAISSLHSSVKLFDRRVGEWMSELKLSPNQGLARAVAVGESNQKMAVAMSNGSIAVLDARNGKINTITHGSSTHTHCINWLNDTQILIADADEVGTVMEVLPKTRIIKKLPDTVTTSSMSLGMLATLQNNSMLRIYNSQAEILLDTRFRLDDIPGNPSAILPLPLNSAFLIGSSQGAIRLMC